MSAYPNQHPSETEINHARKCRMNHQDIDIRAWPPGAISTSKAVHALHRPTGVAVVASSEPSRERNQKLAVERLELLLSEATSPGMWNR